MEYVKEAGLVHGRGAELARDCDHRPDVCDIDIKGRGRRPIVPECKANWAAGPKSYSRALSFG
jgi:hypothetical protein